MPNICDFGDRTWGLMHASQAFFQLSCISYPAIGVCVSKSGIVCNTKVLASAVVSVYLLLEKNLAE